MRECNPLPLPRRRALFAGLAAASLIPIATTAHAQNKIGPDEALNRIMEGHARYRQGRAGPGDYAQSRAGRALGQAPIAAILSCADSRVPPELLFDQGPGGLFVVRVAGNVENAEGMASLEYGTHFLGIPLILVLDHSGCGAVDAAIKVHREKITLPGHLPGLINRILPSVVAADAAKPADLLAAATIENVRTTVTAISTTEPLLAEQVRSGRTRVVGGVYDLPTGKVSMI